MEDAIGTTDVGLVCARGAFHVDPWAPVPRAVITHAHGDHARPGSAEYHCTEAGAAVLRHRLGDDARIVPHAYGEPFELGDTRVSLHPAGHVLGSAQIRIEVGGAVWVVTGDYKRAADPTCAPFEPLRCDGLVTEATFGLPIYRWEPTEAVIEDIVAFWEANAAAGRAAVVFCYALGKAQRILAELTHHVDRHVFLHGALSQITELYRAAGVHMLPTSPVVEKKRGHSFAGELVLAPPSARGTRWMKRLGDHEVGFASGWMRLRGPRRRRSIDRGFVLSDHADWPALIDTVRASGAKRVLVTHGYTDAFARYLREGGISAGTLRTAFEGEPEGVAGSAEGDRA